MAGNYAKYSGFGGGGASLIFADSIVNTGGTVTLVNDSAAPGASKYYGTDGTSTLGYFSLPASGVLTLGAFGSSPNGNAGTIAGTVLTLQPADATNPGGVSTTTQSFAGLKSFNNGITSELSVNITRASNASDEFLYITPAGALSNINPQWQVGVPAGSNNFYVRYYDGVTASNYLNVTANGYTIAQTGFIGPVYYSSAANTAGSGVFSLANAQSVEWRNAGNSADLGITLDASNLFQIDAPIVVAGNTSTDSLNLLQIATPSNPAASRDKLYFKSDDKLYGLSSAGVESLIGPSAGTTPGGSDTQIQYNDSSAFNGDATFTFIKATKFVNITSSGTLSPVGAGTNSTKIGSTAVAGGASGLAIGVGAIAGDGQDNIALGKNAQAGAVGNPGQIRNIAIGVNSACGVTDRGIVIGDNSTLTADRGVCIGGNSGVGSGANSVGVGIDLNITHANVVGLGRGATSSATNQFILGSDTSPLSNVYFGRGPITATATSDVSIQPSGGAGTSNLRVGNFIINPGLSSGNAVPADVRVQATTAGASSSTAQALSEIARFNITGLGLGNIAPTVMLDVNGAAKINGALNMNTHLINSVVDPVSAQDAATKNYVDNALAAFQPIEAVFAASTANIVGTYSNGASGVGATFTITATGALSLDGTSPGVGARVLLKDQSTGFQNGVYTVTVAGSIGVSPILTRSLDYNTPAAMNAGDLIPVINGTVNAVTSWLQTATITTIGTDALVFVQYSKNPSSYISSTLTNTHILVGNASNVATDVAMSGDATLANTGAITLATVNGNVGSFTSANITVNAKGLITAAANGSGGGTVGNWATDTTNVTVTNFGTVTNNFVKTRKVGQNLEGMISFTSGSTVSATLTIDLVGYTIDTSLLPSSNHGLTVGYMNSGSGSSTGNIAWNNGIFNIWYDGSTNNKLYFIVSYGSSPPSKITGTSIANSDNISMTFSVPVV